MSNKQLDIMPAKFSLFLIKDINLQSIDIDININFLPSSFLFLFFSYYGDIEHTLFKFP